MKTSEVIAWFIVGGIVLLFFIGRRKRAVSGVTVGGSNVTPIFTPTPSHPLMCSSGGDIICGVGTIAAGVTEPPIRHPLPPVRVPIMHPTFCTVCNAPVPLKVLAPSVPVRTPLPPVRLWQCTYGGAYRKFV